MILLPAISGHSPTAKYIVKYSGNGPEDPLPLEPLGRTMKDMSTNDVVSDPSSPE